MRMCDVICPVMASDWAGQAPIELQVTTSKFGMAWTKALGRPRSGLGRHQLTLHGMARASLSLLFVPPPNLLHIRSSSFFFSSPSTIHHLHHQQTPPRPVFITSRQANRLLWLLPLRLKYFYTTTRPCQSKWVCLSFAAPSRAVWSQPNRH